MRMCVGCREMKPKKELIRIARRQDGVCTVDRTGRAPGRGAYLCDQPDCLRRAQKSKALERALEAKIEDAVYDQLAAQITPAPDGGA